MNIRRAEHSHAVHVSFILEARGCSRSETLTYGQIHTAIVVAELNKNQEKKAVFTDET